MSNMTKEVDFTLCRQCIHKNRAEWEEPCDICLSIVYREDSPKPVYYEEGETVNE